MPLALILACRPAPIESDADPIGRESGRPELRGTRLLAESTGSVAGTLEVTVTSPVEPGDRATASARATPDARCEIEVAYRSGPSEAQGLDPAVADEEGIAQWSWIVGINTTPGDWTVSVECVGPDGATARGHARLSVAPGD